MSTCSCSLCSCKHEQWSHWRVKKTKGSGLCFCFMLIVFMTISRGCELCCVRDHRHSSRTEGEDISALNVAPGVHLARFTRITLMHFLLPEIPANCVIIFLKQPWQELWLASRLSAKVCAPLYYVCRMICSIQQPYIWRAIKLNKMSVRDLVFCCI